MSLPEKYKIWVDARGRHRLSHAHIQMARELGMNPKKLGKLDNHRQEPWKAPLPEFIEECYFERFKRNRPDVVHSIEDLAKLQEKKKEEKKIRKAQNRNDVQSEHDFKITE